jgi:DNA-binding MarR family transcriptional regulator
MRTTDVNLTRSELQVAATQIRRGATAFAARARAERAGVLTLNQTAVLGLLTRNGGMTPGEVADRLRVLPQSLTRTFAALEADACIVRMPDPGDGRQSLLTITQMGRRVLSEEMRPRDAWVADVVASELTQAEIKLLVIAGAVLERLAEVDSGPAPVEP